MKRGMALILVVVVIAALVAIATPFALSMRLHEKSARGFSARIRARRIADGAANDAVAALIPTHPDEERRARLARNDNNGDDEDWDSLDELSPRPRDVAGAFALKSRSTTETMSEVSVRDERSKIDLNGAPAEVIANLLGVTVTTAELNYDQTDFVPVEDTSRFFSNGDPTSLQGVVRINGEFIGYRDISTSPPGLKGLVRGMFFTRQPPPEDGTNQKIVYPAGSLVQDFRGWKVAWDSVWRFAGDDAHEGELARFETPSAIRKIADFDFGTFAAAYYLQGNGITYDKLREWGIVREKLDRAGVLESVDEKTARQKEDAEQTKRRDAAEKGLRSLSIKPETIARFGGDRAVIRAWELLESLDPDQRESLAKSMRERAEKLDQREIKHLDFWKGEIKRQLDELIALREKTPDIETIGRIELERIRPYITVDSPHEGEAWTDPQVVNHLVRYEPFQPRAVLRIQDGRRFRRGMIVRVRPIAPPGANTVAPYGGVPEYRRVDGVGPAGDHTQLLLFPQLERDYDPSTCDVSGFLPKPINVNSAPKEVLVAVLTGLQTRLFQKASAAGTTPADFVTPAKAAAIADKIQANPLHCHQDLKALLEQMGTDGVLDASNIEAVLQCAMDPANPNLSHAGVPFVYSSGDVYEVTATGIVNDEAANEVARVKQREIVQVAPPHDLVWTIDTQAAFQDRVANNGGQQDPNDPRSLSPAFTRGVWSNLLETFPMDCFTGPWLFPQRTHWGAPGAPNETKIAMGRDWDQPKAKAVPNTAGFQPGVLYSEHFDNEREGHDLTAGGYPFPGTIPTRIVGLEDGTPRLYLGPGSARAWFRVDKIGGAKVASFFDVQVQDERDHFSFGYDLEKKEIVATLRDESLDMLETGGKPRPSAEVRGPLNVKPQNWYHAAVAWKGSERGDLALLIDGKPLGTNTTGTKTTALMDRNTLAIQVESTAAFPDKGLIRVGGYRHPDATLAGDSFQHPWQYISQQGWVPQPWNEGQYYGEVLYYESKTPTSFNIAPMENPWGRTWQAFHPTQPGQAPPTPPAGSTDLTRVPLRGTGRFSEEPNTGYVPPVIDFKAAAVHDIGTPVYLWGYQLFLKNGANGQGWHGVFGSPGLSATMPPTLPNYAETLHQGNATLLSGLPENTPVTLVYKPNPPGWVKNGTPVQQHPAIVQPNDSEIPVVWAGAYPDAGAHLGGWPPQGFIRIGNERLFYSSILQDPSNPKFIVQRGLDGTIPSVHYLWEHVVLESIQVTNAQDYPARNTLGSPEVFVQLTPVHTRDPAGALLAPPPAPSQPVLDPRTACTVEWVSILSAPAPQAQNMFLLPAVRQDEAPLVNLIPGQNPAEARFINLPVQNVPWVNVPYVGGDGRWQGALVALFNQQNGTLGANPGNVNVTVLPTPPAPPPKPGAPPPPPQPPPLPGATKPLREWLKGMEANQSRGLKGTDLQPQWSQWNQNSTNAWNGRAHQAGEKVLPTFVVRDAQSTQFNNWSPGAMDKGDVVTLADDSQPAREERTVLWTAGTNAASNVAGFGPSMTGDSGTGRLVALDDFTTRPLTGQNRARLVRFPSGQLPALQIPFANAKASVGLAGIAGKVDEIVVTQEPEPDQFEGTIRANAQGGWPVTQGLDVSKTDYDSCLQGSNGLTQQLRAGVLMKLDDEIVAVNDVGVGTNGQGMKILRGVLGTNPAQFHGPEGSFWWNFPFPHVAVAEYGFTVPYADQLPVRSRPAGLLHDRNFYVAIDRGQGQGPLELLPIKYQKGNFLVRPRDRWDRGTFRGSFGTAVVSPDPAPGEILFDWPFRYFDRYQARSESIEGVFFEATKEAKGAYFESITWDAPVTNPFQRVLVAVRVDGGPSWDAEPAKLEDTGTPGRLYIFDDPKKDNKILVRGDRVEVRVYATLKPGAFAQDSWKQTPVIKRIQLTYRQPTRVRRREEMLE